MNALSHPLPTIDVGISGYRRGEIADPLGETINQPEFVHIAVQAVAAIDIGADIKIVGPSIWSG